eukprot:15314725-Heterocapsa_arctica.AAC.1
MLKNVEDFRYLLNREDAKNAHLTRSIAHEHAQKAVKANVDMLLHDLSSDEAVLAKWGDELACWSQNADRAIC